MEIDTVNNYLDFVKIYMKNNGIMFLVNRHSRIQLLDLGKLKDVNQITSFSDFNLGFCKDLLVTIDEFRNRIPDLRQRPNVVYIGQVSK